MPHNCMGQGLTAKHPAWLVSVLCALLGCLLVTAAALAIGAYQLSKPMPASVEILSGPHELLPGDATGDGHVDALDLALVASALNTKPPAVSTADLNNDGIVDVYDLVIVGRNYGATRNHK